MDPLLFIVWIVCVIVYWTILYFVVKQAIVTANANLSRALTAIGDLLSVQVQQGHVYGKHMAVQTDLMLAQLRRSGVEDEVLAPLVAALGERGKIGASLPYR
jgi:hypothetical protein